MSNASQPIVNPTGIFRSDPFFSLAARRDRTVMV